MGEDLLAVLKPSAEVERLASRERIILAAAGLYVVTCGGYLAQFGHGRQSVRGSPLQQ